jgi:hypothetical protein
MNIYDKQKSSIITVVITIIYRILLLKRNFILFLFKVALLISNCAFSENGNSIGFFSQPPRAPLTSTKFFASWGAECFCHCFETIKFSLFAFSTIMKNAILTVIANKAIHLHYREKCH